MGAADEATTLGSSHHQCLEGSKHLSLLLSPSPLSLLGSGLQVLSIPSWTGPSSLL